MQLHISVALPEVPFHRLSIFSPLAAPATPISAKFLLACAMSLCLLMNVSSLTLTHESTKLVAPPSSFYIFACYDHLSSMSCFCFREGHRELVANNSFECLPCYFHVDEVHLWVVWLTSLKIRPVYYLLWSFPRILGSQGGRVLDDLWKFTTSSKIEYHEKEYVLSRFKLYHCSML